MYLYSDASEYKYPLGGLGKYDTSSEIGKRKREFVCQWAEVKLRLIVLRTCTCGVISHLYRNKLDVIERGEGGSGAKALVGGLRRDPPPPPPPPGSRSGSLFGGFLRRSSRYNKVQFYCRFAGRERALFLHIPDKIKKIQKILDSIDRFYK